MSTDKGPDERQRELQRDLEDILACMDVMPKLDTRSPEQILGYDEHGLPR